MEWTIGARRKGGRVAGPFAEASHTDPNKLIELVKHLARISAENDLKKLTDSGKIDYTAREKKGPKHE